MTTIRLSRVGILREHIIITLLLSGNRLAPMQIARFVQCVLISYFFFFYRSPRTRIIRSFFTPKRTCRIAYRRAVRGRQSAPIRDGRLSSPADRPNSQTGLTAARIDRRPRAPLRAVSKCRQFACRKRSIVYTT